MQTSNVIIDTSRYRIKVFVSEITITHLLSEKSLKPRPGV